MNWADLPPLTALRAFAAYADTGSMAAAGARLNVSHAAISQQIRTLEDHLGLSLIDRARGGGTLTAEGQVLADTALTGFGDIARLAAELTGRDAERPLHISTTPSFAAFWLMPRLAAFRQRHPDLSLMVDPSPALRPLTPGGIDIAIRYGNGTWAGLDADLLLPSSIAIVAAPALVGTADYASPADLADFHWLQEMGTNEATEYLRKHGAEVNKARGLTSMPGNLMIEAARAGQGIAVTARAFVQPELDQGRLRLLFEDDRKQGYFLVRRPCVMRAAARSLYTWLITEARAGRK